MQLILLSKNREGRQLFSSWIAGLQKLLDFIIGIKNFISVNHKKHKTGEDSHTHGKVFDCTLVSIGSNNCECMYKFCIENVRL